MASKYLYISLNISIFLPRAGNSLYISVAIDFQIAFSWYVLHSISLSAHVYVQIQRDDPFILHIKSYVPYYSVIPPHTGLCPLLQCYPHINSYVPYCSVKSPHTGVCPLLQCYPQINSYVPYCSVKPRHKELFPLL